MPETISIIIPIRNEATYIAACLDAVLSQQGLEKFTIEVLVVDGMSTDSTQEIVKEYQKNHNNIILIENPDKIVPTGFNLALKISKGDTIIRIDGHTLIAADYIINCIEILKNSRADNVGGRMNAIGQTPFGEAVALATSSPFGVGGSRFHYSEKEEYVDSVYMGAWKKEVFERLGNFDEELVRNQDDEFNYRLRKFGGKVLLSPKIKSTYTVRSNPKALWRQYYQYGYWKVRVLQKHPRQMSLRQFVPPLFVAALLASALAALFYPPAGWLLAVVVATYLLADLGASMAAARQKGWRHFARLPLVFPILHLSYGLGFLVGLVKFARRWQERPLPAAPLRNMEN